MCFYVMSLRRFLQPEIFPLSAWSFRTFDNVFLINTRRQDVLKSSEVFHEFHNVLSFNICLLCAKTMSIVFISRSL